MIISSNLTPQAFFWEALLDSGENNYTPVWLKVQPLRGLLGFVCPIICVLDGVQYNPSSPKKLRLW